MYRDYVTDVHFSLDKLSDRILSEIKIDAIIPQIMSTMSDKYIFVETTQYTQEASKWLMAIKRQENATALFVPKTDRLVRLAQFLNDRLLINSVLGNMEKYVFLRINFDPHDTEDLADLCFLISEQLNLAKITSSGKVFNDWIDYFYRK